MPTFAQQNDFHVQLMKGTHQLHAAGHTLKAVLSNAAPSAAWTMLSEVTQVANGNGYTTGGIDIQNDLTDLGGGVVYLTGIDVTWVASGGSIGPFRYVWIYNDSATSPLDALVGRWDYGSAITLASGESFLTDFSAYIVAFT